MAKWITVNDLMQSDYRYELVAPIGGRFADGFNPELTPKQMLQLGVFGGKYMNDCRDDFPSEWFVDAKQSLTKDIALNYFGVDASQSRSEWLARGWIYEEDPRGWFQWYCRYYMGRRIAHEDRRQIGRWRAFARHAGAVRKFCEPSDFSCRPKQRQALLHWAYDSRNY